MTVFQNFYQFSGLKINYERTKVLHIGTEDDNLPIYTDLPIQSADSVKILGITFTPDTETLIQLNISDIVKKLEILMQS